MRQAAKRKTVTLARLAPPPGADGPVRPCDVAPMADVTRERIGFCLQAAYGPVVEAPMDGRLAGLVRALERTGSESPVEDTGGRVVRLRRRN